MTPYQFDPTTRLAWLVVEREAEALHETRCWNWFRHAGTLLKRLVGWRAGAKEVAPVPVSAEERGAALAMAIGAGEIIMLDPRRAAEKRSRGGAGTPTS